jgi:hypothetical protein
MADMMVSKLAEKMVGLLVVYWAVLKVVRSAVQMAA